MVEFTIITNSENKQVEIDTDETITEFIDWMMATEFMIYKTAQKSKAGFEKAMELLCKGAMTYKDKENKDGDNDIL